MNSRLNGKITAVIPVRSGSTRCPNKNIRQFGDTNLLEQKINQLKNISEIDTIIVSSNDDEMLAIAKNLGVTALKRDEYYCKTDTTATELYHSLSRLVKTEIFMYVHAVCPFMSTENLKEMIHQFRNDKEHSSIISVHEIKQFIWYQEQSLNFNHLNMNQTQKLPNVSSTTFGCNIIETDIAVKNNTIFGDNPKFYYVDQINAIDIDTPFDFIISELLYKNNLLCSQDLQDYINKNNNFEILDCTIRDGGYLNDWNFTDDEVLNAYKAVSESGCDYFEIGFKTNRELLPSNSYGKWLYLDNNDEILDIREKYNGCKIAVMIKTGTFKITDFVEQKNSGIDLIRFLIPKKDGDLNIYTRRLIEKSVEEMKELINLGYEITVNFACGDHIVESEIDLICECFKSISTKIKALYLADTFGSFTSTSVKRMLYKFRTTMRKYNINIPMAFHSHNNCDNALEKTKAAIEEGCIMVDSCISGMGRGVGNLQTEYLLYEFNYDILPIIQYIDKYMKNVDKKRMLYYLGAKMNCHPNYIKYIDDLCLSIEESFNDLIKIKNYCDSVKNYNFNKNIIKDIIK